MCKIYGEAVIINMFPYVSIFFNVVKVVCQKVILKCGPSTVTRADGPSKHAGQRFGVI